MTGMYLRECLIERAGPISSLDLSLEVDSAGNPKPVLLVGKNGTGKTILLAYILDALGELAKKQFNDIVIGQQFGNSPFIKISSARDIRSMSGASLSLLEFSNSEDRFSYIEKVGTLDSAEYAEKLRGRFDSVKSWPKDETFHKTVVGDPKQVETLFGSGSVCFFPSSRHERPHWLNVAAVENDQLFVRNDRMKGQLKKPLIIERSADSNRQWLMDIFLDSLVDWVVAPTGPTSFGQSPVMGVHVLANMQDKMLLKSGKENVERLLRSVLEDEGARLILNYRNAVTDRLSIQLSGNVTIPSLDHLSTGQSLLFNLFATIIRYAEKEDLHKSIRLHEIEGIVLVDEIDAHLHADLQYEVLPRLIKLFPKVQFIVTSHSPLFLLGMEKEFGHKGIQILEMPTGQQISTERFEEFRRSFEYYRQTAAFEEQVAQQVMKASKPLLLTEGKTDVTYIKTALELLGHADLLAGLEIEEVGDSSEGGTKAGGHSHLDTAKTFLENNQEQFPRRVLLLYDCETNKTNETVGNVMVRKAPLNPLNGKVVKGIENLLPPELFEDHFYDEQSKPTGYGRDSKIVKFRKAEFCDWVCNQRRDRADFLQFDTLLVPILRELYVKP